MTDSQWELVGLLVAHPSWRWVTGMRLRDPNEQVLGWYDGRLPEGAWPDLDDFGTAGLLLGVLDGLGVLVDVAREGSEWIVAVTMDGDLRGWAGESLGEAAGWALIETWGPDGDDEEALDA